MTSSEFDIYKYISLYNRHKVLFVFVALTVMTLFSTLSYLLPKKYEAKCTGIVEMNLVSDLIKGITVMPSMDESLNEMRNALSSRNLILKTIKEVDFGSQASNDYAIDRLLSELQVNTTATFKEKKYFVVTFRYKDPGVAREYVNALVRNYIEQTMNANRNENYEAGKFLSEQIEMFKAQIEEKEKEINQFKEDKGDLANYDRTRIIDEIDGYQRKIYDLKLRRNQLEEEKKASNPQRIQLLELQNKLNAMRAQYTDNYPEVITVKSQIKALQQEMKQQKASGSAAASNPELWKIEAELKAVKENEAELERYIATRKLLLDTIPPVKAMLEKLESERLNKKNMYDLLLIRKNQSEVSKQVELQDKGISYQITEPATTPQSPVSPNRKKIMLMGIFAGLACGAGLLLVIDYLDPTIRSVGGLSQAGISILAVIPLISTPQENQTSLRKALILYLAAGIYFSGILTMLAMELFGLTLMERLAAQWHLPAMMQTWLDKF